MSEIQGRGAYNKRLITAPYRVVQNGKDICVVNQSEDVVTLDRTGNLRWVYDGNQAKLGSSFNPLGICTDKYQNLLVTDSNNHCVHYLNADGQLLQVILTREQVRLLCYWGISVDDATGQVWLGNSLKDVVIAKYIK